MKNFETANAIRTAMINRTATEEARAEFRAIRKTCEAHRDALIESHKANDRPAATVAALVEGIGYENAVEIIAAMVRTKGEWDQRIGATARAWASEIMPHAADEIGDVLGLYYSDYIHPAHMDQIARAMMAYTPTDTPTETETEPATVPALDLLDDLDTGDHGDRLNDYRDCTAYICDAIAEIADADTSIYYADILDFVRENPDTLADVITEGLYDPAHNYDFYKHAQAAEYMTIERDIYDHLADSLMMAAVHFLRYDLDIVEIPEELADLLRMWCDDADINDRMNEIPDKIREYLDGFTEEVV